MLIQIVTKVNNIGTQYIFQHLNGTLRLSISLGIIGSAEVQTWDKGFLKAILEMGGIPKISIKNNRRRNVVESDNLLDK